MRRGRGDGSTPWGALDGGVGGGGAMSCVNFKDKQQWTQRGLHF